MENFRRFEEEEDLERERETCEGEGERFERERETGMEFRKEKGVVLEEVKTKG